MTYIPSVHKVQIGREATYADGAAATFQPHGIQSLSISPKVEAQQVGGYLGNTMPAIEAFVTKRWAEGNLDGIVDYLTLPLWLDGMFGEDLDADSDGSQYLADLDWASPLVEKSLSLRYGQTGLIYLCPGVLPYELTFAGASGEPLKFSSRFFANPASSGASFAALTDATNPPSWAMGHDALVYLDAGIGAAPGTTPLTDLAFSFEARITSNRKPVWHLGEQAPDSWRNGKWAGSMRLVIEADAARLAFVTDILANTAAPEAYAVRVRHTDGVNTFDLDFVGQVLTPPSLIPELDGIVTVELDMVPVYGTNAAILSCWKATVAVA